MIKQRVRESLTEDYLIRIIGFLISIFLFWLFDSIFKAGFLYSHYIIFISICTAGILLSPLYYIFKYYDKILHFLSPFLLCFIIFFMVNNLQETRAIKLVFTFTITVSLITLMELGEYVIDKTLNWDLQGVYIRSRSGVLKLEATQSKIDDSMQDIIFGIVGCLFFILIRVFI